MAVDDVVRAYGAAWNEPDEAARRKLLDEAWADDGVYCDPMGRAEGRAGLVEHIAGFQQQFADHRIDITSAVDEHDGFLRFTWVMQGPDGAVMDGIDFGELAPDGRLRRITGFFGPLPSVGGSA